MTKSAFDAIKHHNYVLPDPKFWGTLCGKHPTRTAPNMNHNIPLYTRQQVIEMLNAAYGR